MTRVLVVDDDPDVRALFTTWLRPPEFEVVLGADGYQAVQLARTRQPDVIFLDINMPAAGGFTVHERLSRITAVASIPIVYISADHHAATRALASGAAAFLPKPLDKASIVETVRSVTQHEA